MHSSVGPKHYAFNGKNDCETRSIDSKRLKAQPLAHYHTNTHTQTTKTEINEPLTRYSFDVSARQIILFSSFFPAFDVESLPSDSSNHVNKTRKIIS